MEVNPDTEALPISTGVVGTMLLSGRDSGFCLEYLMAFNWGCGNQCSCGTRNWGKSRLVEEVLCFAGFVCDNCIRGSSLRGVSGGIC